MILLKKLTILFVLVLLTSCNATTGKNKTKGSDSCNHYAYGEHYYVEKYKNETGEEPSWGWLYWLSNNC